MFQFLSFQNYLISDPTGRNPENTVMTVAKQGFEPLPFTGQFPTWDYDLWNVSWCKTKKTHQYGFIWDFHALEMHFKSDVHLKRDLFMISKVKCQ